MAENNTVKGIKKIESANTPFNAINFLVRQTVSEMVETSEVVRIDGAEQSGSDGPAGYASATPLVSYTDGEGNAIPSTQIPRMPFLRPQAGKAAIIMDPQPGDKAIAIAMKRDSSGVTSGKNETVQPSSFRSFDLADSYLINGFLGETPEIWLHLNPVSGDISLSTKTANIDVSCRESGDITVKTGQGNVLIQAGSGGEGTVTIDGQLIVTRNILVQNKNNEGVSQMHGGFNNIGGTITSNSITLESHTHNGVDPGDGNTGSPNTGT